MFFDKPITTGLSSGKPANNCIEGPVFPFFFTNSSFLDDTRLYRHKLFLFLILPKYAAFIFISISGGGDVAVRQSENIVFSFYSPFRFNYFIRNKFFIFFVHFLVTNYDILAQT